MSIEDNNIQLRIERSIYKKIEAVLIEDGYLPDITTFSKDAAGQAAWNLALKAIETSKKFAVEVFGHSAERSKGLKAVPRIVIIPRRMMPGDIGSQGTFGYQPLPDDPDVIQKTIVDYHSTTMYLDINIVSGTATHDRYLNYVLNKAIGVRKFITFYDNPEESFLIEQFNYYDLPDGQDSIEEKAYSYRIPDIWMYEEFDPENSNARITSIEVDTDTDTLTIN